MTDYNATVILNKPITHDFAEKLGYIPVQSNHAIITALYHNITAYELAKTVATLIGIAEIYGYCVELVEMEVAE